MRNQGIMFIMSPVYARDNNLTWFDMASNPRR